MTPASRLLRQLCLLLVLVCAPVTALAQVDFAAVPDRTELGLNETLKVQFTMNVQSDNFVPPDFKGFSVRRGGQSISNTVVNGKRQFKRTITYFLSPETKGKKTVGQATMEFQGNTYKTSPIKISVSGSVDRPNDPNDPDRIIADRIQLRAEVSKATPYVNEAVLVTYRLYVPGDINVSGWTPVDMPEYRGFWNQQLEQQSLKVENCEFDNEQYRCVTLLRQLLYPQKSGKLELTPLTLNVDIEVETPRLSWLGERIKERVTRKVASPSRSITARDLPTEGKPANFTGAVGRFTAGMTASKSSLDAGESLDLIYTVTGKGNMKLIEVPDVELASSLEVYEPRLIDNVRINANGMTGSIGKSFVIVPQSGGDFEIPVQQFNYFDPEEERYKVTTTRPIKLDVGGAAVVPGTTSTTRSPAVLNAPSTFAYIDTEADLSMSGDETFFRSPLWWAAVLGPLGIALLLGLVLGRKNTAAKKEVINTTGAAYRSFAPTTALVQDVKSPKTTSKPKRTAVDTGQLQSLVNDPKAFYAELEHGLTALSRKRELQPTDWQAEYDALLATSQMAKYTPVTATTTQQDLQRYEQLMQQAS